MMPRSTSRNNSPQVPETANVRVLGLALSTWRWIFWACVLAVLILALMPSAPQMPTTGWDKSNHLLTFSMLVLLGQGAYPGHRVKLLLGLLAYGGLIELLQSFTSYRFAEGADLLADGLGLLLGWGLMAFAGRLGRGVRR